MSRFLNQRYSQLETYTPGEQPQDRAYIKLNTNESPYPPSAGVLTAVSREAVSQLNLYPDPDCGILRRAIAAQYGVRPENIFTANGSDDILAFSFQAFCGKDSGVAFPDISYGFYRVYAEFYGIPYREIPLREDFTICPADYCGIRRNVILANPNAPTGLLLSTGEIARICASNPDHIVLIDEAYIDFGGESSYRLIQEYENLITVMTYSKSRSMAGARLGFAIANEALIEDLNRIKFSTNPYSINRLTLLAGTAAVRDHAYYEENCRRIAETREYTKQALLEEGFLFPDSKSNFLLVTHPSLPGAALYQALKARGILVRHFSKERIREYVRITIGTQAQMEALVDAMREILKEKERETV